ncbi:MAG: TolC family protein [Verrucomicrobia bacterium]|nr:MAG: TolC family protein [Verrucomicrobiota bacterium]
MDRIRDPQNDDIKRLRGSAVLQAVRPYGSGFEPATTKGGPAVVDRNAGGSIVTRSSLPTTGRVLCREALNLLGPGGRFRKGAFILTCSLGLWGLSGNASGVSGETESFVGTDLVAYLRRANEANPRLRAFENHYDAAMHRIPRAGALPDPRIQITSFVESVQTRTGSQENVIMVAQTVPWFGKLDQKKAAASSEAEALWFMYQARQLALARSVSTAFFEYAHVGKSIELTRKTLGLLRRLELIVEERIRGGGDVNPLLRLQVEIGMMDDREKSLQRKRDAQSALLDALLARSEKSLLPWPEWEIPETGTLELPVLISALEANNPELAMLDRKISSAQAHRELARLENRPDLTLGVNYIQTDAYTGSTLPDAGRDPWGVTIGINIPIWGSKNEAGREEALAAHSAADYERRDRENMLKAELSARYSNLDDANRRLSLYGDELLSLARQALDITRTSYESGRATILDVIDSERSLLELELNYWRAAADAWQNRIIIQTLVNQPIAGTFSPTSDR